MTFKSTNFMQIEAVSLEKEITKLGTKQTPLSSLLMGMGKTGKATATTHSWREVTLSNDEDITEIEGNKNISMYQTGRATLSNILEILEKGASVSGTVQAMSGNAINGQFAKEVNDRLLEMKYNLEKRLTSGIYNDGSTTPFKRRMKGLENWVHVDNIVEASTPTLVTEADIITTVKKLWDNNGSGAYYGLVNAPIKSQIDLLYKDSYSYVAQENIFGLTVQRINTSFGTLDLILTPYANVDKLTVFDTNDLEITYLRKPQFQPLARTGDTIDGFVVTEATLYVSSPKKLAQLDISE